MKMFEFSIIASGLNREANDFEARFYDNGCDDALVAFQKGRIIIDFAREAETIQQAISSAVEDVRRAGAKVDRVEPDPLVSLSDIAQRSGLTKTAVHNYATGERRTDFPAPIARVTTTSPLWDWSEVSGWLFQQGALAVEVWHQAVFVKDTNVQLYRETANPIESPDSKKQIA